MTSSQFLRAVFSPHDLVELRIIMPDETVYSGLFNDLVHMGKVAAYLDQKLQPTGIYYLLNPVKPDAAPRIGPPERTVSPRASVQHVSRTSVTGICTWSTSIQTGLPGSQRRTPKRRLHDHSWRTSVVTCPLTGFPILSSSTAETGTRSCTQPITTTPRALCGSIC